VSRVLCSPPSWLSSLCADPSVAALGIDWLPPQQWAETEDLSYPAWTIHDDEFEAADVAVRRGKVLVATGPSTSPRSMGLTEAVQWFTDPDAPDLLWCALSSSYPGWLWVPVVPDPQSLTEVLGGMFPTPYLLSLDLPRVERGFLGFRYKMTIPHVYSGERVEFNGHDLDRYFALAPFVDGAPWGSVHLDDPRPADYAPTDPLVMSVFGESVKIGQQLLGRVPSMTWRTVHSRSYLGFEIHMGAIVCARMRFRPAPASHRAVLAQANDRFGLRLPEDLPLDVVGALTGFGYTRESDLMVNIDEPESDDQLAAALRIMAALWEGDLSTSRRLLSYADHPSAVVRSMLERIGTWYNMTFLVQAVALHSEADPDIMEAAEWVLDSPTVLVDDENVFRDYFAHYALFIDEFGKEWTGRWPDEDDNSEDED
jgi:hypothetical protein